MMDSNEVEIEFRSWAEMLGQIVGDQSPGLIFRGMPNWDYSPISKLERVLNCANVESSQWKPRENSGLAFFKERARLHLANTPHDDDLLGWLALMQHYGAPTRLTDSTVSPFVACYFALEGLQPNTDAALWSLNAFACRNKFGFTFPFGRDHMGVKGYTETDQNQRTTTTYPGRYYTDDHAAAEENELLRMIIIEESTSPLPLPILRPDRRMAAQQACFVACGKLTAERGMTGVELLMRTKTTRLRGKEWPVPSSVKKIRIPFAWRDEMRTSLAMMNITADTLFPGLDGVGKATEDFMSIGGPMGFRQAIYL